MTLTQIRDEVRWITKTDTTTFSSTDINREVNTEYKKLMVELLKVQGYRNVGLKHVTTTLFSTSGLVSGDVGYNGEYPFPTDLLRPVRFELKYASTDTLTQAGIYELQENPLSEAEEDTLNSIATQTSPMVVFYHDSFFTRPLKTTTGNITAGIHIWYEYRESDLSVDADTPGFEETFHDLLVLMVACRFYLRHPSKRNAAVIKEKNILMGDFKAFYRKRINNKMNFTPLKINMN